MQPAGVKGGDRDSIGENNLGDFRFVPNILLHLWGFLGILNIV